MNIYIGNLTVALLLAAPLAAQADPDTCRAATEHYATALAETSDALAAYTRCIDGSRGDDACASEFLRLQVDQDDFAAGVSAFQKECPTQ